MKTPGPFFKFISALIIIQTRFLLARTILSLKTEMLKGSSRIKIDHREVEKFYFSYKHLLGNRYTQKKIGRTRYRHARFALCCIIHSSSFPSKKEKEEEYYGMLRSTRWINL